MFYTMGRATAHTADRGAPEGGDEGESSWREPLRRRGGGPIRPKNGRHPWQLQQVLGRAHLRPAAAPTAPAWGTG
jgi:hypothetical protein